MFCRLRENIWEERGHINKDKIPLWNRYYAKLSWFIKHIGAGTRKPCSHFFLFKTPSETTERTHAFALRVFTYFPIWSPSLIVGRQMSPHSLPPRPQHCLVADRCLVFMNILCTARPQRCTRSFDLHFKRKFCLCHCQRLFVTRSAFAAVTCLIERSNRRVTRSSSGFTIQGMRAAL